MRTHRSDSRATSAEGSSAKLVSASASSTVGFFASRMSSTRRRVRRPTPIPGPISTAVIRSSASVFRASSSSSTARTMMLSSCFAYTSSALGSTAIVVSPAPIRAHARAASRAAPVIGYPPKISACPRVYLFDEESTIGSFDSQSDGALRRIFGAPSIRSVWHRFFVFRLWSCHQSLLIAVLSSRSSKRSTANRCPIGSRL